MNEYNKIEAALKIIEAVYKKEKIRTEWDTETGEEYKQLMEYRADLLSGCEWLSNFILPIRIQEEVKRIYNICRYDRWRCPSVRLYESPVIYYDHIAPTALSVDMGKWERVMIAERLNQLGLLTHVCVGIS